MTVAARPPAARRLAGLLPRPEATTTFIAFAFAVWELIALTVVAVDTWLLRVTHLSFAAVIVLRTLILEKPATDLAGSLLRLWGWVLSAIAVLVSVYIFIELDSIQFRAGVSPTNWDLVVGTLCIILILDLMRRTTGWALPILVTCFILYALFGYLLPGFFWNRGYSFPRLVSYLFSSEGILGVPIGASATYVFLFVLFGAVLNAAKAGDLFMRLASYAVGGVRGGPAKMAVIGSAMFGTISGSAVSNVVVSGSITIPLMKRYGYPPTLAGAVEAVASSGGQLMPPVMGAAAFLMADIAGIPYGTIAMAAALPAIFYFFSLYWIIDLESAKRGLKGLDRSEIPGAREALGDLHLITPVLVVLYFLLVEGTSAILAGLWGGVVCIVVSWFRAHTRLGPGGIYRALAAAGSGVGEVAITCAGAGIIIGVLSLTGLGIKIANSLMAFSGGSLFLALTISAVVALILGVGMPTSAAYVICAITLAPGLVELGVPVLSAHMFVFYFACISTITPPVALAAYAAAPIAQADPMRVGFTAFKLGLVSFLIPYGFIYGQGLLLIGGWHDIALAIVTTTIGILALGCGLSGWIFGSMSRWIERAVCLVAALLLIWQGWVTDLIGIALFATVLAIRQVALRGARMRPLSST